MKNFLENMSFKKSIFYALFFGIVIGMTYSVTTILLNHIHNLIF